MGLFLSDLRYAIRQLVNSPGFTIAALSTIALGIGANTAVFSAVYSVLVKSLPFTNAERILTVAEVHPQAPGSVLVTYADFVDWRNQQTSFEQLAAYSDLNPATVSLYRGGALRTSAPGARFRKLLSPSGSDSPYWSHSHAN